MDKPAKIVVWGSVLAVAVAGGGYLSGRYLEREIHELATALASAEETCRSEQRAQGRFDPYAGPLQESQKSEQEELLRLRKKKARALREDFGSIQTDPCQTEELATPFGKGREIEERLSNGKARLASIPLGAYAAAIGILALSLLPWAWYFLLRRIREMGDAIRGK